MSKDITKSQILWYINLIKEPNRSKCKTLIDTEWDILSTGWGSTKNHQAYPGGYLVHIYDCMELATYLYMAMDDFSDFHKKLNFKLSDALLVLFLHDLEKPWKGRKDLDLSYKNKKEAFRNEKFDKYGFEFTDQQLNALKYIEGEGADYTNEKRVMGELAAFCHMCDVASSRIFWE